MGSGESTEIRHAREGALSSCVVSRAAVATTLRREFLLAACSRSHCWHEPNAALPFRRPPEGSISLLGGQYE